MQLPYLRKCSGGVSMFPVLFCMSARRRRCWVMRSSRLTMTQSRDLLV